MAVAGPYYFAWVDPGTAFNPAVHNRMDEYIFSFKRVLKEGDKPTLELVIRNPHIGLLNSSRKRWAWFSRDTGSTAGIVPLFYGRLVAAPTDLFKEMMTVKLIAWPTDYFMQRQKLAEQIKASGPYDPVFIEVLKRDDPDTVLEAVSGLWCIDPVTHAITISDILNGAGNVDVNADHHLYEEMNVTFDQTNALTNILMIATVGWNQTGRGYINMTNELIASYAGDATINGWPKPLTPLGGGYTVARATAIDLAGVEGSVTVSQGGTVINGEKEHRDGDFLTSSVRETSPSIGGATGILTRGGQNGFIDAFAVDADGDPAPINIPLSLEETTGIIPLWVVATTLQLYYGELQRARTERIQLLLQSDLQSIIVDPLIDQNSETIVKSGTDVGVPIVNLLNWTTVSGTFVGLDTIVFPDNPTLPSQRTAQICVVAGTAGIVEPDFSDIPGVTTSDNTVVWSSMGMPQPTETAYDWTAQTNVPLGEVILPVRPLAINFQDLIIEGLHTFPLSGATISRGSIYFDNGEYFVSTEGGLTQAGGGSGSAEFFDLGPTLPDGKTHFMCVQAGQTGPEFHIPRFNNTLHAQTTDGTVIWAAIGTGDIPIGGTPGDVWGRSYFTTARGQNSLEYLISIMRARARMKARAVTIDFTPIDPFGLGLSLTVSKTATITDTRLGGGVATGKIVNVEHACDGKTGRETCHAQIGCAIGKDNVITGSDGNPTYSAGYVQGYRVSTDGVVLVGDNADVGYSPLVFAANDDGLIFPLDYNQVVISEGIFGNQGGVPGAVLAAMAAAAQPVRTADGSLVSRIQSTSISIQTALHPIWYEAVLKPLTPLAFNNYYNVKLTKLTCQRGINLEGASTP